MRIIKLVIGSAFLWCCIPVSVYGQAFAETQGQMSQSNWVFPQHFQNNQPPVNIPWPPQQQQPPTFQTIPLVHQQIIVPNAPASGVNMNAPLPATFAPVVTFSEDTVNPQPASMAATAAESMSGEGNDNGTNPAQNTRPMFIFTNEFYSLVGPNKINTNFIRFKYPILEKQGNFMLEVPFTYYDLNEPAQINVGGLADIKAQLTYNFWASEDKRWTAMWFNELYIPSADNVLLTAVGDPNEFVALNVGTGKFVFGQGLGFVYAIKPNFIMAPIYFYERSFAGSPNRQDIHRGKLRCFMMYAWENGMYVLPEFQVATNFINGNNDVYLAPEIGYSTKGSTFYVKAGLGLFPDPNDRNYGVELGIRILY